MTEGIDMKAWKETFAAKGDDVMEKFWATYDPKTSSIWTMVYDEAEYNEDLESTKEIATAFLQKTESLKDHCFGVIHTLESLDVEGLFVFNAQDPEKLFGINEDTSWFSWSQLGPDPTDQVKAAVAALMAPSDGKLNGKVIKDTQAFC